MRLGKNRLDHTHDPPTYAIQCGRLDRDGDRPELDPIRGEWIFFPAAAGKATTDGDLGQSDCWAPVNRRT